MSRNKGLKKTITSFSSAEIKWIIDQLKSEPGPLSPLRDASEGKERVVSKAPFDECGQLSDNHRQAFSILVNPHKIVRLVISSSQQVHELCFYGTSEDDTATLIGFWRTDDGWRLTYPCSAADILEIADNTLGLQGDEVKTSRAYNLTAEGLSALASAVDSIRFRRLSEWIYRQRASNRPFTHEELKEQLNIGLGSSDPRWVVTLLAALAPPGTFALQSNLIGALGEITKLGFIELGNGDDLSWSPTESLSNLASEWFVPNSALSMGTIVANNVGTVLCKDYCIVIRGQGPLVQLDLGARVRQGPSNAISMMVVSPKDCLGRLDGAIKNPPEVPGTAIGDPESGEVETKALDEVATSPPPSVKKGQEISGEPFHPGPGATPRPGPPASAPAPKFCSQCAAPVKQGARFCTKCGAALQA